MSTIVMNSPQSPMWRSPVTAADRLLLEIQRTIVEGEIESGSKISEPELARKFNVSRAPLREALARLERCHLRSEEHTSELQSRPHLVCRLLLEKKKKK